MSTGDDPERLLAEALRAQAARAPLPTPATPAPDPAPEQDAEPPDQPEVDRTGADQGPADGTGDQAAQAAAEEPTERPAGTDESPTEQRAVTGLGGYGLYSGGQHLGYALPEDTEQVDPARAAGRTSRIPHRRVGVGLVLLLAVLLGLAAGAVVGLVSLL